MTYSEKEWNYGIDRWTNFGSVVWKKESEKLVSKKARRESAIAVRNVSLFGSFTPVKSYRDKPEEVRTAHPKGNQRVIHSSSIDSTQVSSVVPGLPDVRVLDKKSDSSEPSVESWRLLVTSATGGYPAWTERVHPGSFRMNPLPHFTIIIATLIVTFKHIADNVYVRKCLRITIMACVNNDAVPYSTQLVSPHPDVHRSITVHNACSQYVDEVLCATSIAFISIDLVPESTSLVMLCDEMYSISKTDTEVPWYSPQVSG